MEIAALLLANSKAQLLFAVALKEFVIFRRLALDSVELVQAMPNLLLFAELFKELVIFSKFAMELAMIAPQMYLRLTAPFAMTKILALCKALALQDLVEVSM